MAIEFQKEHAFLKAIQTSSNDNEVKKKVKEATMKLSKKARKQNKEATQHFNTKTVRFKLPKKAENEYGVPEEQNVVEEQKPLRSPPNENLGINVHLDPNLLREKMTEVMKGQWVEPVEKMELPSRRKSGEVKTEKKSLSPKKTSTINVTKRTSKANVTKIVEKKTSTINVTKKTSTADVMKIKLKKISTMALHESK